MLILLSIVWLCFTQTNQISDPNCLRANPEILDGHFKFFNKYDDVFNVTKEDVLKHTTLFSTRFKRAHELMKLSSGLMEFVGEAISRSSIYLNQSIEIYFRLINNGIDIQATIDCYKEAYETVRKINSYSRSGGPVVGLYLEDHINGWGKQLEAVELVFGSKQNSSFRIGQFNVNCSELFKIEYAVKYLQRLDFITCGLVPKNKSSPEASADDVVTSCIELRNMANNINLSAEFHCLVLFPSRGLTHNTGVVGSLEIFQRFWCRIVDQIIGNKLIPKIIMPAFDASYDGYRGNDTNIWEGSQYHLGWWRRRHTTSYEPGSFVEKVEELEAGREHRNCSRECEFCSSSRECCDNRTCQHDESFQPFEKGLQPLVCQSPSTSCVPRLPKISVTPPSTPCQVGSSNHCPIANSGGSTFIPVYFIVFGATVSVVLMYKTCPHLNNTEITI